MKVYRYFISLVIGIVLFVLGVVFLKAQEGKTLKDTIRISVENGFGPEEVVIAKDQDYSFEILDKSGNNTAFVDIESDLFSFKKGHILSMVGEIESGDYFLNINSNGTTVYKKNFKLLAKESHEKEYKTEDNGIRLNRKINNKKMEFSIVSDRDVKLEIDEYVAQGLVASSSSNLNVYVKNGLQNLRFFVDLKKGEEKNIDYEILGVKDEKYYSFGPIELNEVVVNKPSGSIVYTRKKVATEGEIRWFFGKNFLSNVELIAENNEHIENGWMLVDKMLIKNDKNRVLYKSSEAGSEASYETDIQSGLDSVPILLGKYKAYVVNGILTVFSQEEREEEGVKKINFKQIFP